MENKLKVLNEISEQINTMAYNFTDECIEKQGLKSELNLKVFLSKFFNDLEFYTLEFELGGGVVYIHNKGESISFEVGVKSDLYSLFRFFIIEKLIYSKK